MKIFVSILVVLSFQAFSSTAFADSIAGMAKGETFGFDIVPGKITGTWGDKAYYIDLYKNEWKGSVGKKDFDLQLWNPDITGSLPCGEVNIGEWSTELEGVICGDSFIVTTGSQNRSNELGYDTVVSALVAEFPTPAQGMVREILDWNRPSKK